MNLNWVRNQHLSSFLKSFCFLFLTTSLAAFILFFVVNWTMKDNPYKAPVRIYVFFRGYNLYEIAGQPFPYLLSIAFVFSFLGAIWASNLITKLPRLLRIQLLIVPWIALILTGPIWGVIWSINRWPPQYFSNNEVMMLYYRTDALSGLQLSWLSAIQSFPINVLSYATVCGLLYICKRRYQRTAVLSPGEFTTKANPTQPPSES